jgi:IS30 family transposase
MGKHKSFTVNTNVKVYFCDPQSPWQRGTNENINGLIRQYFPKKTDLSVYSQADLNKVALRLNQRPRQTLGFETPASKLQASVCIDQLSPPCFPGTVFDRVESITGAAPGLKQCCHNRP